MDSNRKDVGELFMIDKQVKYYAQTVNITLHHFYINGEIEHDVDKYIDMLNVIKTCEAQDKIYIYLNTPGGSLTTTIQIISAMNQSQAEITTFLEGDVCSAGTMIFLSGHNYVVNDHCSFMIHNCSHGGYDKGAAIVSQVDFMKTYFKKMATDIYSGFLTDEEIVDMLADKDFWMDSDEVAERLKGRGVGVVFDGRVDEEIDEMVTEPKPKPKPKPKSKAKSKVKPDAKTKPKTKEKTKA